MNDRLSIHGQRLGSLRVFSQTKWYPALVEPELKGVMTGPWLVAQDNFPDMSEVRARVAIHFRGAMAPFLHVTEEDPASDDEQATSTHKKKGLKLANCIQQTLWSQKGLSGPTWSFTPVKVNQLCTAR